MALHRSVVQLENGRVRLFEEAGPGPVTQEDAVFRRASAVLMCASYRNQALHAFTRPALVAVAMTTASGYSKGAFYYNIIHTHITRHLCAHVVGVCFKTRARLAPTNGVFLILCAGIRWMQS